MNTGSSVSKGTSNFFIHIVIGAMLVGTLRNRKFGHGRECFAPSSPYLWRCSKFELLKISLKISNLLNFYLTKSDTWSTPIGMGMGVRSTLYHVRICDFAEYLNLSEFFSEYQLASHRLLCECRNCWYPSIQSYQCS